MPKEKQSGRPSVYLVNKCETLQNTINFFLAKDTVYCRTLAEKLLVFLAQIDFWDWEVENLIYSFDSFKERSKAWSSTGSLCESLHKHGFLVQNNTLKDLDFNRDRRQSPYRYEYEDEDKYYSYVKTKVQDTIAPFKNLNEVLERWNRLLKLCEDKVLLPRKKLEAATEWNVETEVKLNLDKYRKTLYEHKTEDIL